MAILSKHECLLVKGPKLQLGGMPLKESCLATSDGPEYPFRECHWRKGWGEGGGGGGQEETTHYLPIYPAFQRTAPYRQSQKRRVPGTREVHLITGHSKSQVKVSHQLSMDVAQQ